jgi:hypothetical protein
VVISAGGRIAQKARDMSTTLSKGGAHVRCESFSRYSLQD